MIWSVAFHLLNQVNLLFRHKSAHMLLHWMKPMRSTDFSQLYQLWINSILFQGACNVGRELVRGFDVLPCRDCGSWNSRLLWLELWFWGIPGFCPQNFFLPRWGQFSSTHWTSIWACSHPVCPPGPPLLALSSLEKLLMLKTSWPTFIFLATLNLG